MTYSSMFQPKKQDEQKDTETPDLFQLSFEVKDVVLPLEDFPRSEQWRLVTEGCQHNKGIDNFTDEYYSGMQAGFAVMGNFLTYKQPMTPTLMRDVQVKAIADVDLDSIGFREGVTYFPVAPDFDNSIGLSIDGLDEFCKAAELANNRRWNLVSLGKTFRDKIYQAPDGSDERREALFEFNSEILRKFEEGEFLQLKDLKEKLTECLSAEPKEIVIIFTTKLEQREIFEFLRNDILELETKLSQLPKNTDNEDKIIAAIVQFIRKLNQNHFFPDGNGRTCMILLNCLLIRHLKCMTILRTPAHLTGFSTRELVKEVQDGIAELNKYKVTAAKNFIAQFLKPSDIPDEKFKEALNQKLAKEHHIAIAQLNELYMQMQEGTIKDSKDGKIQAALVDLYRDRLTDFIEEQCKYRAQGYVTFPKVETFNLMLQTHEIHKLIHSEDLDIMRNYFFPPAQEAEPPSP